MGRFFVICPVVRCNSKQSRSVTTHSSSKIVFCKFSGVCLKHSSLTTYHGVPRTSSADQSCRQRCNFFFTRLGFTCFFSSTTWFRVFNWRRRILGREKRSAQASAHPLSQAQSGLFCVSLFVCVVLRKKGRILEVDFDGDAVVLVDSDLWFLKICRQSVKLHQDEAILPPLIQVTG